MPARYLESQAGAALPGVVLKAVSQDLCLKEARDYTCLFSAKYMIICGGIRLCPHIFNDRCLRDLSEVRAGGVVRFAVLDRAQDRGTDLASTTTAEC